MTPKEFALLASALRSYFPREDKLLPTKESMELWYRELQDIPYPTAEAALRKWVATSKWSPSIAELREMAAEVTTGDIPDWGTGWRQVCDAMRNYGREYPKSAYASMHPVVAEAAKGLGSWWNLCVSDNTDADRANFRMIYEPLAKRKREERQLSLPLQNTINKLQAAERLQIEGRT
jgi:hypothetical protein